MNTEQREHPAVTLRALGVGMLVPIFVKLFLDHELELG